MSTIKISQLPAGAAPINRTDVSAYVQSGTTVALTIDQVRGFGVNVKDYGATGNGITDDSDAIIAAAAAAAGTSLYFPGGNYKLSKGVLVPSNTTWYGDGRGVSNILIQGTITSPVVTPDWGTPACISNVSAATNIVWRDLSFIAAGDATTSDVAKIHLQGATGLTIDNCAFTNFGRRAAPVVYVQGLILMCTDVYVTNCLFESCSGDGGVLAGDGSANVIINGCRAIDNDDWGIVCTNATGNVTITSCYFENNRNVAVGTDQCPSVVIANNVIVGQGSLTQRGIAGEIAPTPAYTHDRFIVTGNIIENCGIAISADDFPGNVVVANNQISGCDNYGILVANTENAVVNGNHIAGNSTSVSHGILLISYSATLISGNHTVTSNYIKDFTVGVREILGTVGATPQLPSYIADNYLDNCTPTEYSLDASNFVMSGRTNATNIQSKLPSFDATLVTTTASAGAATLPANPLGFITGSVGATTVKIPYYAA